MNRETLNTFKSKTDVHQVVKNIALSAGLHASSEMEGNLLVFTIPSLLRVGIEEVTEDTYRVVISSLSIGAAIAERLGLPYMLKSGRGWNAFIEEIKGSENLTTVFELVLNLASGRTS
jgi:hypothetical protein